MQHLSLRSVSGFTLLETIVATGILVTALAGIAQLFVLAARISNYSGVRSVATLAAQTKMESLRALRFGYDDAGDAITDSQLEPSTPGALTADVDGYMDVLDAAGQVLPDDTAESSTFVRRWAITPFDDLAPDALVIAVCVFRAPAHGVPVSAAESCLATIRSRQP